jgi:hypothetical protein
MASPSPVLDDVNRYVQLDLLGRGGMGAVHRALDRRDGREVAFKRLNAQASDDDMALELFEREFHMLSQLAHPRIIEVYDYGIDAEGAYYTMELLAGEDVSTLGKVAWHRACELLRDVASSLAILHSRRLIHGDLSSRNVRCTLDGRAKLLDFGAMMPMGLAKRIVGTPPFISPELLNMQALDGRSDLYALGALGYFLLTGRQAYPAVDTQRLRDLWRKPLVPPSTFEPSIPAALSELIVELLQLNRNARPRSAALVMERLCTIAALPYEEAGEVAQAYLATPTLIGRDELLTTVRKHIISALGGRGSVILISGPSGSGRSRALDACVLEAKLLGSQVVRIDRSDAESGSFGVARALCRQLFELAPAAARSAAQLHAPVLAHLIGAEWVQAEPAATEPDRRALLLALRDFVLSVVRSLRLLIAVDDTDGIDEASASLLIALAQKTTRRTLCMVLTTDSEGAGSAALDLLSSTAETIALQALSEAQTVQLLAAVFGETNHLLTIAARVYDLARGNPRATMQLAKHLVDQGIARYETGSFILPERLREEDLPPSLAAALQQRLRNLDGDALELARVLGLTEPSELPAASYVELTTHRDKARTYRAIDQLVRIQMLEAQGERYRLSDPTWHRVTGEGLDAATRVKLHARLASALEQHGTLTRRSYHLMEGEQPEAAIRLILAQFIEDPNEPADPLADYVPGLIDQLERAAVAAETLSLPAPLRIELRMKVCGASQFLGDVKRFMRTAPPTLVELMRDSSLSEYNALDASMEPMARLTEAFTRVQARHDATPDAQRGLPPAAAIRELARLCVMYAGIATIAQDVEMLESIPSLKPFVPLSPAVAAIQQFNEAALALMQARDNQACAILLELIERLSAPDGAGLGALYNKSIRLGALYIVGLIEAGSGVGDAIARVAELEHEPGHRVNAQRVHAATQLMQGNAEAALAAQKRAELVMLQDGQQQRYPGSTVRAELYAHWLSADIAGLKHISERIASMAAIAPNWDTLTRLARCLYRQAQGDMAGALAELEPILPSARPLKHRDWAWVRAAYVHTLVGIGRVDEALEVGFRDIADCQQLEVSGYGRIAHPVVLALLAAERIEEAVTLSEELLTDALQRNVRGLALGALHELRARVAAAAHDEATFSAACQRCSEEYAVERNPTLAARYQRMIREVQPLLGHLAAATTDDDSAGHNSRHDAMTSLHQRLRECPDAAGRALCVLGALADRMGASCGYLYAMREGQLELVSALTPFAPPETLRESVAQYLTRVLDWEQPPTARLSAQPRAGTSLRASALADSRTFGILLTTDTTTSYRVLLESKSEGESVIAGVAVLELAAPAASPLSTEIIESLAAALLEEDDVDPVTCLL